MTDVSEGRRLLTEARGRKWHPGAYAAPYWHVTDERGEFICGLADRADASLIVWLRNNAAALLDAAEAVERVRVTVESLRHQVFGDQAEGAWYVLDAFSNALEVPGE